jgi:Fe-S-cluster containining protein
MMRMMQTVAENRGAMIGLLVFYPRVNSIMSCLCDQCSGLCCRYFALPIDNPTDKRDYDNIRWYLLHQNVVIFVEDKQWYMGILNRCKALQPDNRCGIYETRPAICRSYSTDNCDYHAGDYGYDRLFTSAEALWEYAMETLAAERSKRRKKSKKPSKKRGVSRATRARRLSELKPLRLKSPELNGNGNGRAIALPLLNK